MTTFAEALENPSSQKKVFARMKLKMEMFAWVLAGSPLPGIWYTPVSNITDVISSNEDEVAMTETVSLVALDALDTSSVGGFFYDFGAGRIYVKPKTESGTDVYSFLYIATVLLAYSKHGGEYLGLPHDSVVTKVPRVNLRVGEVFTGKVAQIGGGSINMQNTDNLFVRNDVEIDGLL